MFKNDQFKPTRKRFKNLFNQLVNTLTVEQQFELLALQLDRVIEEQDLFLGELVNFADEEAHK